MVKINIPKYIYTTNRQKSYTIIFMVKLTVCRLANVMNNV